MLVLTYKNLDVNIYDFFLKNLEPTNNNLDCLQIKILGDTTLYKTSLVFTNNNFNVHNQS